jgi:SCP-2 sterol transfer family
VAELLSQEWLDQLGASVEADAEGGGAGDPAASAVVQHVINGAPEGSVSYWTRIDRGRVVEAALGEAEKPDLTFTVAYDDAVRLDSGEVEPSAAYMQGRLKADGDMTKLFALLVATHRAPA